MSWFHQTCSRVVDCSKSVQTTAGTIANKVKRTAILMVWKAQINWAIEKSLFIHAQRVGSLIREAQKEVDTNKCASFHEYVWECGENAKKLAKKNNLGYEFSVIEEAVASFKKAFSTELNKA